MVCVWKHMSVHEFPKQALALAFCSPAPSTVFLLLMIVNLSLCHKEDVWFIHWLLFLSFTLIKKILCTDGTPTVILLFLERKLETPPKYLVVNRNARLHSEYRIRFLFLVLYFLKDWFHNWPHVLNKMNLHCPERKKTTFFLL